MSKYNNNNNNNNKILTKSSCPISGDTDRKIERKKKKETRTSRNLDYNRDREVKEWVYWYFRVEFIRVIRARRRSVGERTNKPWVSSRSRMAARKYTPTGNGRRITMPCVLHPALRQNTFAPVRPTASNGALRAP